MCCPREREAVPRASAGRRPEGGIHAGGRGGTISDSTLGTLNDPSPPGGLVPWRLVSAETCPSWRKNLVFYRSEHLLM